MKFLIFNSAFIGGSDKIHDRFLFMVMCIVADHFSAFPAIKTRVLFSMSGCKKTLSIQYFLNIKTEKRAFRLNFKIFINCDSFQKVYQYLLF